MAIDASTLSRIVLVGGHGDTGQNGDDGYGDQHFDQGEGAGVLLHKGTPWMQ
ncbi:hypothetical protein D3C71_2167520 [compost metagenome]